MRTAVCPLCGFFCAVLPDGTLVQHSEANLRILLCPGSRSPASGESRNPAAEAGRLRTGQGARARAPA
jgi:hypothetical protein